MYGNDARDLAATLSQMERLSLERANFNRLDQKELMKEFVRQDRRFDEYDADALVARVQECRSNCASLDLDDPRLKGGEARPLERRW